MLKNVSKFPILRPSHTHDFRKRLLKRVNVGNLRPRNVCGCVCVCLCVCVIHAHAGSQESSKLRGDDFESPPIMEMGLLAQATNGRSLCVCLCPACLHAMLVVCISLPMSICFPALTSARLSPWPRVLPTFPSTWIPAPPSGQTGLLVSCVSSGPCLCVRSLSTWFFGVPSSRTVSSRPSCQQLRD